VGRSGQTVLRHRKESLGAENARFRARKVKKGEKHFSWYEEEELLREGVMRANAPTSLIKDRSTEESQRRREYGQQPAAGGMLFRNWTNLFLGENRRSPPLKKRGKEKSGESHGKGGKISGLLREGQKITVMPYRPSSPKEGLGQVAVFRGTSNLRGGVQRKKIQNQVG